MLDTLLNTGRTALYKTESSPCPHGDYIPGCRKLIKISKICDMLDGANALGEMTLHSKGKKEGLGAGG